MSHECLFLLVIVAGINMAVSALQLILVTLALDTANHQLDAIKAQENSLRSLRVEMEHMLHKLEPLEDGSVAASSSGNDCLLVEE